MHEPIHTELANRIKADFLDDEVPLRLPSVRSIARHYGVSYRTAWQAAALLPRPLVTATDGVGTSTLRPSRRRGDAARELADHIAGSINSGEYQFGIPLPKFDYFVHAHRVTRKTVAAAFLHLSSIGIVHKLGRRWQFGPRPPTPNTARSQCAGPPVILWVLYDQYSWVNTFNNSHLAPFIHTLRAETARTGILLSMRFRHVPQQGPSYLPGGLSEVERFIKRAGSRYLGAVIMEHSPERSEFVEWVKTLSAGGKHPVVYFDSADLWPGYTRDALGLHERYYRFCHDESSAVRMALAHLTAAGHRRIGFPVVELKEFDWSQRRFDIAARATGSLPDVQLIRSVHSESIWDTEVATFRVDSLATFIQRVSRQPNNPLSAPLPSVRSNRHRLIKQTPSMKALLDQGATALISMNDRMAFEHYWWCQTAGIDIPNQLSQISFDHVPEGDGMPITTVDFGFSRLGYLAAHAVIGDIKVPADRTGSVAGTPMVVDRGSVVAPRSPG